MGLKQSLSLFLINIFLFLKRKVSNADVLIIIFFFSFLEPSENDLIATLLISMLFNTPGGGHERELSPLPYAGLWGSVSVNCYELFS